MRNARDGVTIQEMLLSSFVISIFLSNPDRGEQGEAYSHENWGLGMRQGTGRGQSCEDSTWGHAGGWSGRRMEVPGDGRIWDHTVHMVKGKVVLITEKRIPLLPNSSLSRLSSLQPPELSFNNRALVTCHSPILKCFSSSFSEYRGNSLAESKWKGWQRSRDQESDYLSSHPSTTLFVITKQMK